MFWFFRSDETHCKQGKTLFSLTRGRWHLGKGNICRYGILSMQIRTFWNIQIWFLGKDPVFKYEFLVFFSYPCLARRLQLHRCGATCAQGRMDGELCSHFYPWLPSLYDHLQLSGLWETDADKRWRCRNLCCQWSGLLRSMPSRPDWFLPTGCYCSCWPASAMVLPWLSLATSFTSTVWSSMTDLGSATTMNGQRLSCCLTPPRSGSSPWQATTLVGKRRSRIGRERLMDECDVTNYSPWLLLASKSWTNIELITHSQG